MNRRRLKFGVKPFPISSPEFLVLEFLCKNQGVHTFDQIVAGADLRPVWVSGALHNLGPDNIKTIILKSGHVGYWPTNKARRAFRASQTVAELFDAFCHRALRTFLDTNWIAK